MGKLFEESIFKLHESVSQQGSEDLRISEKVFEDTRKMDLLH